METVIGHCEHCREYITKSMNPAITVYGMIHQRCLGFFDSAAREERKKQELAERMKEWRESCISGPSGSKKEMRHRERQIFEKPRRKRKGGGKR